METEFYKILNKLYPFNYGVCGRYNEEVSKIYKQYFNFKIHKFDSDLSLNQWHIPKGWEPIHALIYDLSGNLIYNALEESKLGLAYLSPSFSGIIEKEDLIKHITFRKDIKNAIVYDWTRLYRLEKRQEWGLSIPYEVLSKFKEKRYRVEIKTNLFKSEMFVYDGLIKGKTNKEYLINAHNCHPYQANDDLSGVVLTLMIAKWLSSQSNLFYSYRLLIAPELFGPLFWLSHLKQNSKVNNILASILLKSLGNNSSLKIQHSYTDSNDIDELINNSTQFNNCDEKINHYKYRDYYGNDEIIFEAPPFKIPSITLTRYPFTNYHTHLDNIESIDLGILKKTFDIIKNLILSIESNRLGKLKHEGSLCLSSYELYKPAPAPGIDEDGLKEKDHNWHLLMHYMPRMLDEGLSLIKIANKFSLPIIEVFNYAKIWEDKKLIRLYV